MDDKEKKELISVINSGWFTEASKTRQFEKMFADFVGAKYAIAVTSGTTALYVGLKALGIVTDDQVIVPDLTFVASPNAVKQAGAKPVLVDIEPNSLNIDITKLKSLITKRTKAIMPVDFNGRSANILKLKEFAHENNLMLIEDACHAIGSYHENKHMGTLSDVAAFSFSTPKIITTGQGGMIITNDKKINDRCLALKDFGRDINAKQNMRKAFHHTEIGYNFKFTEFQAAVGIAQLKKLKKRIRLKKNMLRLYMDLLSPIKQVQFIKTDLKNITPWMIDVLLKSKKQKNNLIMFLNKRKIEARIFYPPIHSLQPYKELNNNYKVASDISSRGLWLPSSVSLNEKQIKRVCDEINNFFI